MEQLKAELVVFKGLMSNVSAASPPLVPTCRARAGLLICTHFTDPPPSVCASIFFPLAPPTPRPSSGEEERTKVPVASIVTQGGLLTVWPRVKS